jgi:hypothetical protein
MGINGNAYYYYSPPSPEMSVKQWLQTYRGYLFYKCKIEIYFTEWAPKLVFSRVAKPQMKIHNSGVHEWNIFLFFTGKNKFSFYFMLLVHNLCEFDRKIPWNGAKNDCLWRDIMTSYTHTLARVLNVLIRNVMYVWVPA